jgi:hypothetical protein
MTTHIDYSLAGIPRRTKHVAKKQMHFESAALQT